MLGLRANGDNIERDALITMVIIFVLNFLQNLPQQAIPSAEQIYTAFITSSVTALIIYCVNKGIQYKHRGDIVT